jgi:uncharacterized metal-binding protein YceD (DUF177 family)
MKIVLNTLPRGKSEQIFDSVAQLQQDESIEWKPLQLELKLSIDRQGQNFYLHGKISCTGLFICDAGMEEFEDTLESEIEVMLTFDSKYLESYEGDEIVHIPAHQAEYDLYPLVHDAVLLVIPISHRCGPDCKAGQDLQKSIQAEEEPDERWAKLKDLFNE